MSASFLAQIRVLPDISKGVSEEAEAAYRSLDAASRVLERIRDRMCRMALHPTCPKAQGESRPGAGRRTTDPISEAQLVAPNPEGIPPATPASDQPPA